jgi:hypothetical protein
MEREAKVYKVINDVDDEIYVGATKECLSHRLGKYRTAMRKGDRKSKFMNHMKELGTEHFKIILLEEFKSSNIDQMKAKRQEWIDKLKPTLNQTFVDTNRQEERKIKQLGQQKQCYDKTKNIIVCECGGRYDTYNTSKTQRHFKTKKHKNQSINNNTDL